MPAQLSRQRRPKTFPKLNQVIPLNASPFTFININATVKMRTVTTTGFSFVAMPGHFDGSGSTVVFHFYNDSAGWLHINVKTHILKDRGAVANATNQAVARQK